MPNIFQEVNSLRQEGKLHRRLMVRTGMLFSIALILGLLSCYHIFFEHADVLIMSILALIGFLLGLLVFSRMNVVNWNEEKTIIQAGRMDTVGFITLGLYIAFEVIFKTVLRDFYPGSASAFILAVIFGTLLGRAVGIVIEIHRVYRSTHTQSDIQNVK